MSHCVVPARTGRGYVLPGPATAEDWLMAEIKNDTLNCGFGRALRGPDFAGAKSACAEVQRGSLTASMVAYG